MKTVLLLFVLLSLIGCTNSKLTALQTQAASLKKEYEDRHAIFSHDPSLLNYQLLQNTSLALKDNYIDQIKLLSGSDKEEIQIKFNYMLKFDSLDYQFTLKNGY